MTIAPHVASPMRSALRLVRAMRNYAGHRLSPWLGHLMVSRQETARHLLTPGEVMQLPPGHELVLISGIPPIRAHKARYYEDRRLKSRVLPPPVLIGDSAGTPGDRPAQADDWTARPVQTQSQRPRRTRSPTPSGRRSANGGIRREPCCPSGRSFRRSRRRAEFALLEDEPDDDPFPLGMRFRTVARQAALDLVTALD
jgi:type IV secretion system protein VirD4